MTTYYLKATSEAALWEALEATSLAHKEYDREDPLNVAPDDHDPMGPAFVMTGAYKWISDTPMLDIIGTMYSATGTMLTDGENMEYPEMEAVDGYHANLREELTDEQVALLPTIDTPTVPYRKWAGDV
jgi:hypothetical protein